MAQQGTLYIVSSPSGAGKSSLIKALLERYPNQELQVSVSHTTRDTRPGEENGVHYHFVSKDDFKALIEQKAFFEWAEVFGNFYGTSRLAIEDKLAQGVDIFLDIDWQGARQVREIMPAAKSIFILPPSREELESRLNKRGQDSAEVIHKRMAQAQAEMSHYDEYDYLLINDEFEQALAEFGQIIEAEKLNQSRQAAKFEAMISNLLA